MVSRGEMWWGQLAGAKRRPFLVLTRAEAVPVLSHVVCVPATTNTRGLASEVDLDGDDGMPAPCSLSLDNVVTISKGRLDARICSLSSDRMREVCQALAHATGCAG